MTPNEEDTGTMAKDDSAETRVYRVTGSSTESWSKAADRGSQQLYARLETRLGKGRFTFKAIKAITFTAVPEKNPGSIQSFKVALEVTVSQP
jgi:hypothetical protein